MAQSEGAADQELVMMEAGQQAGGALPVPRTRAPLPTLYLPTLCSPYACVPRAGAAIPKPGPSLSHENW